MAKPEAAALAAPPSTNSLQKLTANIKVLSKLEDYPVWARRVQAAFVSGSLWESSQPVSNALSNNVMLNLIDDHFVDQLLDGDCSASTIWNHISGLYNVSDLASKTTALTQLIAFDYSGSSMLDNKMSLLNFQRHLKSAFGGETNISLNELVVLFALVNLPAAYTSLRTNLLTSNDGDSDSITLDILFSHLMSEEKTQSIATTSFANRAGKEAGKCEHGRFKKECYKCTPSSRPTCPRCTAAGLPETQRRHKPGHPYLCKSRKPLADPSTSEIPPTTASAAASSTPAGLPPSKTRAAVSITSRNWALLE